MTTLQRFRARTARTLTTPRRGGGERGDIPGWVMITLMTAALVAVIWGVADDALTGLFNDAITKAKSPT